MFSKVKYLFLYLYEASERMEEKSAEIAQHHQERMEAFRLEHKEMETKAKEKFSEMRRETKDQVSTQVRNIVGELGLATRTELDEIKDLVGDISKKLDKLDKK